MSRAEAIRTSAVWDGHATLSAATRLWFAVTVAGQWAFLYYLAGFYGRAWVTGHLQEWNRNPMFHPGYVAGDTAWDVYFGAHVLLATVIALGGVLQMVPQIRDRAPWFHRWNGRAFMLTALTGAVSGLWMSWVRNVGVSGGNSLGRVAVSLDGMLIIGCCAVAWLLVRRGRFELHRRWALRLFMVANGVWFLRLGVMGWYVLTGGVGMTDNLDGPVNLIIDFASYLLPLAILELYLRSKQTGTFGGRVATAVTMLLATVFMGIGIFGLGMMQIPLLRM
jgi:Predicted membrane protein (DUF2306)